MRWWDGFKNIDWKTIKKNIESRGEKVSFLSQVEELRKAGHTVQTDHPCESCCFAKICAEEKKACKDFFEFCETSAIIDPDKPEDRYPDKKHFALSYPNDRWDVEVERLRHTDFDVWDISNLRPGFLERAKKRTRLKYFVEHYSHLSV
ncbi:MAG TPA: hypothetical protein PLM85_11460 [Nitrosomonas sp.]|nr:hypothetical protein [Nitrosomonas sp.]